MDENIKIYEKFNNDAVFSDETPSYRHPFEPRRNDEVWVKLRVKKDNIDSTSIVWNHGRMKMYKKESLGVFDYYEAVFPPTDKTINYYFEIERDNTIYYYSKVGVSREPQRYADFVIFRDFEVPLWSKGCIMYQIYVDRFMNGSDGNNVKTNEYIYLGKPSKAMEDWYAYPEAEDIRNFYGGDLQGVMEKLEYLKKLGVDAIYFNPIFVSPSNHKYDIQDYDHIDPHLGKIVYDGGRLVDENDKTNENAEMYIRRTTDIRNLEASDEVFVTLVKKAHSLGIKVILDGVFNHCGAFNKWLDREKIYCTDDDYEKGAYVDENSPYKDYFVWNEAGWPDGYDGWWGFPNHPKLHFEKSEELFNEIMGVTKKWLQPPFNADGWRVDVAADLGLTEEYNHKFWREFRKAAKTANPQSIILAEHYGEAYNWLQGDEWDTIMNYDAFMEPVTYFLTGMEKHSDAYSHDLINNGVAFANTMVQKMARLPAQTLFTSMNQLSNHDHSRFLTRTNGVVGRVSTVGSLRAEQGVSLCVMRLAVLIQMTWIGSPTLYYGDEAGLCGFTDPDCRRTYPWGKEDLGLIEYHSELIRLRKKNQVLSFGSTMFLNEGYGLIVYGRFDAKRRIIVAINNLDRQQVVEIPVWRIGSSDGDVFSKLYYTYKEGFGPSGERYTVKDGVLKLWLADRNGMILSHEEPNSDVNENF